MRQRLIMTAVGQEAWVLWHVDTGEQRDKSTGESTAGTGRGAVPTSGYPDYDSCIAGRDRTQKQWITVFRETVKANGADPDIYVYTSDVLDNPSVTMWIDPGFSKATIEGHTTVTGMCFPASIDPRPSKPTPQSSEIDESLPPLSQERLQQELLLEYIGALGEALRPERSR